MNWTGDTYQGFLNPFRRSREGGRNVRRLLRGVGRMRGPRLRRHRGGCCCCPAVFLLGLAGLGLIAGSLYLGIRLLPLALHMLPT
jgi:hypothetical protein